MICMREAVKVKLTLRSGVVLLEDLNMLTVSGKICLENGKVMEEPKPGLNN